MKYRLLSATTAALTLALTGCASYTVHSTPKLNPVAAADHAKADGVYVAAKPYDTPASCKSVFSDNLVGGGYVPVQVSLENNSRAAIVIYRTEMHLVLSNGQKLSAIPANVVVQHFQNSVVGGAFIGGVFGVSAADHANSKRKATFERKELSKEIPLAPGQTQTGFLYFKVKPAQLDVAYLETAFTVGGKTALVKVPL